MPKSQQTFSDGRNPDLTAAQLAKRRRQSGGNPSSPTIDLGGSGGGTVSGTGSLGGATFSMSTATQNLAASTETVVALAQASKGWGTAYFSVDSSTNKVNIIKAPNSILIYIRVSLILAAAATYVAVSLNIYDNSGNNIGGGPIEREPPHTDTTVPVDKSIMIMLERINPLTGNPLIVDGGSMTLSLFQNSASAATINNNTTLLISAIS